MNKNIFLIVGEFQFKYYERDFIEALKYNNINVYEFNIWRESSVFKILLRIEYYFSIVGIATLFFYIKLFFKINSLHKDRLVIFFWRPTLINSLILKSLKLLLRENGIIVSYNNDNPFSDRYNKSKNVHQRLIWRNFIRSIPFFDISFVYRPANLENYKLAGAKNVFLFPPSFPDYLIQKFTYNTEKKYDIIFIGHYEPKHLEYINFLLDANIDVKIYGPGWTQLNISTNYKHEKITPIYGEQYYQALNSSKVALCFLSDLNDDVYTRRNFEIPMCKTAMLSERTLELETFFKDKRDCYFFSNKEELLLIAKMILNNDSLLQDIAISGYRHSIKNKYGLNDRVKNLLHSINIS